MRSLYTLLLSGLLSITAWHNICAGEKILIGVDTLTNSSAAGDDILTGTNWWSWVRMPRLMPP